MFCDFDYCIFNKEDSCILNEVRMDSLGMCDDCIIVSTPPKKLEEYKRSQLQEIMSRYDD